jgi:cysteinyl-tRNA synthetase, unknown class
MRRLIRIALATVTAISLHGSPGLTKPRTVEASPPDAPSVKTDIQRRRAAMASVKTWAIQLRFLDRNTLATSPFDLVVIDHAPHPKSNIELPFTSDELLPLRTKPDGRRRIVLAYLSVGEAERYRYYWQPAWDAPETRPKWLAAENPRWAGNYQVQFADPDWQSVVFGSQTSYLDRIIAAGFDGVYLDRVDAFQDVEQTFPGAQDAMTGFVQRLADHAHRVNPNFLVVMQNAEELAQSKSLLTRLDGIAKEDLLYGFDNRDDANPQQMVTDTVANLRRAKRFGIKVLVLEYAHTAETIGAAQRLAEREGFVLHVTDRMLGVLSPVTPLPAPAAGDPSAATPR